MSGAQGRVRPEPKDGRAGAVRAGFKEAERNSQKGTRPAPALGAAGAKDSREKLCFRAVISGERSWNFSAQQC